MKKSLLTFLLFLMVIPFEVNAKEYCKVVDGDGKSIGSEIACGTEHFYVIDSNDDEVKMLAKYNLYTGVSIYKEKLKEGQTCYDVASSKGGTVKSDAFYNEPGYCYYAVNNINITMNNNSPYSIVVPAEINNIDDAKQYCYEEVTKIENAYLTNVYNYGGSTSFLCSYVVINNKVLQNENAKSAHWDENLNYLYPQIGDVYITPSTYNIYIGNSIHTEDIYSISSNPVQNGSAFYDYMIPMDKIFNNTYFAYNQINTNVWPSLYLYRENLKKMNIDINNISQLSLSELNQIIKEISNKELPLQEWGANLEIIQGKYTTGNGATYGTEIHFGDLKPYIPDKYSWLYSTTYWNSSVYHLYSFNVIGAPKYYFVFTAEQSKLCGAGFAFCAPQTSLGCGIRPVITIPNELQYLISTKTDENGTIDAVENSLGGESIQFKVTAKKGYKLGGIIIRTNSDEQVEFSEGEIIKNEDGSYSIDKNQFTNA